MIARMIAHSTLPLLASTKPRVRRVEPWLREHRVLVLTVCLGVYTGFAWLPTFKDHALPNLDRP